MPGLLGKKASDPLRLPLYAECRELLRGCPERLRGRRRAGDLKYAAAFGRGRRLNRRAGSRARRYRGGGRPRREGADLDLR